MRNKSSSVLDWFVFELDVFGSSVLDWFVFKLYVFGLSVLDWFGSKFNSCNCSAKFLSISGWFDSKFNLSCNCCAHVGS